MSSGTATWCAGAAARSRRSRSVRSSRLDGACEASRASAPTWPTQRSSGSAASARLSPRTIRTQSRAVSFSLGAPPSRDSGLFARGDRFDPRGCRPGRRAARRPARHAGIPRPRPSRLSLSDLPDAPAAALRTRREAPDGHAIRGKPRHDRNGAPHLCLAANPAADPAAESLTSTPNAEGSVGGGAKKLTLDLVTGEESPGRYARAFIPSKVGDYIFHVFGDAGSTKVDERFESGPNTFDGVVSTDQLQFPDRVAANADLSARLDSMQTLVIAAIVIAGLALLASVGGLVTRRR